MSDVVNKMQTVDGRAVTSATTNELSVTLESNEQKERARLVKLQADELEMKLNSMKRPVYIVKPGPFPRFR